jgi:hypothetical protein
MTCAECNNKIVLCNGVEICESCKNMQENVQFEDTSVGSDYCFSSDKSRWSKFIGLIDKYNFPSCVRMTLVEVFPTIEQYFLKQNSRCNFISIKQLLIILLEKCGYTEFTDGLPALKTKARVNKIRKFVDNALDNGRTSDVVRLDCFELIEHGIGELDDPKATISSIYSDHNSNYTAYSN